MGLFNFFSGETSNKKIHERVFTHFQDLGPPKEIGTEKHKKNYLEMLKSLDKWAKSNDLGYWKRSAIAGSVEDILRTTYKNTGLNQVVQEYVNLSRRIIMDMTEDYNW